MYSYKERIEAVKLFYTYDRSYSAVIRKLGYPDPASLRNWVIEYEKHGDLHQKAKKEHLFTEEKRQKAIEYYWEHGQNIRRTCSKLGYPSRTLLRNWLLEDCPEYKPRCRSNSSLLEWSKDHKEEAVIELETRACTAEKVAEKYGVSKSTLYKWRKELLPKKKDVNMAQAHSNKKIPLKPPKEKSTHEDTGFLQDELEQLKQDILQLQEKQKVLSQENTYLRMENDVLKKASELLKKEQGINVQNLGNREKAIIINALRDQYPLKDLLDILSMAKSSYCYQRNQILNEKDKYADVRKEIHTIFNEAYECYGYRRIHISLQSKKIIVSEKVVRRLMKEEGLKASSPKRRKYNAYKGEITPSVPNLLERDFQSETPNEKWLSDITEFSIPAGKVYLSPIIDCFDGLPVSWSISTSPNAELVNTMLDGAIKSLQEKEKPIIHTDRGCHYRWPYWIKRIEESGLTRSMSRKGTCADNSACEGFFGRLKNEFFYGRNWKGVSLNDFIDQLDQYITWYANKRIKISLNGKSPTQYRQSLGLVV